MVTEGVGHQDKRTRGSSDEFLLKFARSYEAWKKNGFYPVEIRDKLAASLEIGNTTYYRYLQIARKKGFINDSYEENMAKANEAKRDWLVSLAGRITGIKFFFPKRVAKGHSATEVSQESSSPVKSIFTKAMRIFKRK
jgi:hypothetical protein